MNRLWTIVAQIQNADTGVKVHNPLPIKDFSYVVLK